MMIMKIAALGKHESNESISFSFNTGNQGKLI